MSTWVLLRGLTREAGHWGDFPARLQARLGAGDAVVALDLPGCGERHRDPSPATVGAITRACRDNLTHRGRDGPVVLVALSLGAMVAVEWAHQAPAELAGCVLINTSLRGHAPFFRRLRPACYLRIAGLLWPGRTALAREWEVLRMTSSAPGHHGGVPARWAAIRAARPVAPANALRQLLAAARYGAPRQAPPVPLLVLSSAGDRLVSPACSARLAQRWVAPHAQHPSAGHDLPLDAPDWVLAQLAAWHATHGL